MGVLPLWSVCLAQIWHFLLLGSELPLEKILSSGYCFGSYRSFQELCLELIALGSAIFFLYARSKWLEAEEQWITFIWLSASHQDSHVSGMFYLLFATLAFWSQTKVWLWRWVLARKNPWTEDPGGLTIHTVTKSQMRLKRLRRHPPHCKQTFDKSHQRKLKRHYQRKGNMLLDGQKDKGM